MENSKAIRDDWFEQSQPMRQESSARSQSLAAIIADFMVWLTIIGEKRKTRHSARRAMIISRWLQLSGDSLRVPFPGVVMI